MRLDLARRKPLLANTTGGMSGPAIFPLAVRMVYQVYEAVSIPIVGMGGVTCARDVIELMLAGATAVSIAVIKARHWFHVPHQCITIPSVIPMIPGVLMYRALFAFIEMHGVVGEVTVGMNNAIKASLAIICIALGVAVPNLFFRRFIEDTRKRKLLAMLVERKKRNGEFVTPHAVGVRQGAHRRTRKEKNHARDTHE